jgi:hypothetical protein
MANDLYGELLARALQRQAPPGHFPAFVTPGEANLLRSRGGGVPPGGGQYMAGGLPAFFSPADPGGAPGMGADMGDPEGTGIGTGIGAEQGGATGEGDEFGGSSFGGAGATGEGDETANEGMVAAAAAVDAANAAAAQAQAVADAQASDAIADAQAQAQAQAQAVADAQAADAIADAHAQAQAQAVTVAAGTSTANALANALAGSITGGGTGDSVTDDTATTEDTSEDTTDPSISLGGFGNVPSLVAPVSAPVAPAPPHEGPPIQESMSSINLALNAADTLAENQALADAIALANSTNVAMDVEQTVESQVAEAAATTPLGDVTPDSNIGHVADAFALANTATSLAMSEQEAADAHEAAVVTLGQDINIDPDTGMNVGGIGSRSPGAMWGANAEVANKNKSNISIAQIQALNAEDAQGYAINNPNPSEASLRASLVFAELNPTITNAIIGAMGLMPGTIGFASYLVGLITDKGLLNIPAVRAIPGMQNLRDIVDIPRSLARALTDPFTEPLGRALTAGGEVIGEALSAGQQAIVDALEGIIDFDADFDEPDGFADGDEIFGGEPEIEFVPPVATEAAEPAPPARTFAEVDEETRNRILANILGGLRRIGRPTEGVTAFGPLFGGAQHIPILDPIVGAPRPSPAPQPGAAAPSLLTQYQQGYYVETGGGYYRSVGPPGTSSIGQVWKRDELPAGAVIAPKGTKSSDVWGTTPGQGFIKQSPYAGTLT